MPKTRIEELTERMTNKDAELQRGLDRYLGKEARFEASDLKKEDIPAFVAYWFSKYPPQVWQHPDGSMELGSIWAIELRDNPDIEGGRELYDLIKENL